MPEPSVIILHIEDNEANRYVVSRILQDFGCQVVEAATGEAGLKAVAEHQPDLIILDINLPGLNGYEVCRRIKSNSETAFIPILHLSASFVKSQDKARGLDSGADAYLAQPVEPLELIATVRSLLRIRRAEDSALSLAREWQTTFDSINDGIGLLDYDGKFLRCNQALMKLLDKPLSEILGSPHQELLQQAFKLGKGSCFYQVKETRHRQSLEIQAGERWFAKTIDPILNEQGAFTGAVFILAEITDRKQIEDERAQLLEREQEARAESEAANRMKDEFLATLSHELRSPLNAMLGWARLLITRKFDEATTMRAIETIERNAQSQAQLVEDLLDVSRIIRGQLRLNISPVELSSVIKAALETARPAAGSKNIELQAVLDPGTCVVAGDAERLQQIVWNLLSNAVKFTPKGGRVQVQLEQVNSNVEIAVIDTGHGISPEFLPFVFDRFRQADSSSTRSYSGLGLGLAIVRHLVELHGGTVRVDSLGEGQGATFTVTLPLMPIQLKSNKSKQAEQSLDLNGIKVLVVDDDKNTREFITFLLELHRASVTSVASAGEALVALTQFKPDVLLSDVGMPDVDGYTLIRQVRTLPPEQGGQIPAISLTAYAGEINYQQALAAGFQKHITKPVEPDKLVEVIASLVIV